MKTIKFKGISKINIIHGRLLMIFIASFPSVKETYPYEEVAYEMYKLE